jgi:uncharacterized damage-inducible protein DinB
MLKRAAISQLLNLKAVLNQLKDEHYNLPVTTLKKGSISKHVRHIVEFYGCLLFNETNNLVNYDERKRNLLLEENLKYTLDYITEIIDNLEKIETNRRLMLVSNYGSESMTIESSLYRELTYNIEHTVHHMAIISIAISSHFDYVILPEHFGYADSTINYLKSQKVA